MNEERKQNGEETSVDGEIPSTEALTRADLVVHDAGSESGSSVQSTPRVQLPDAPPAANGSDEDKSLFLFPMTSRPRRLLLQLLTSTGS
jgi:hypothetical protein